MYVCIYVCMYVCMCVCVCVCVCVCIKQITNKGDVAQGTLQHSVIIYTGKEWIYV